MHATYVYTVARLRILDLCNANLDSKQTLDIRNYIDGYPERNQFNFAHVALYSAG